MLAALALPPFPPGPTSANMMPARTRPALVTRCWALRERSPVSSCMMHQWPQAVYLCEPISLLSAASLQATTSLRATHSARTCHACSLPPVLLAVRHAYLLLCAARLEIRLAPGSEPLTPATLQSAALSIGSQQRAQLCPGTVPGPDDSPPGDNLPWPLQVSTSTQC